MTTEPMVSLPKSGGRRIHNHKAESITDLETARKIAKELVISNYDDCGLRNDAPGERGCGE